MDQARGCSSTLLFLSFLIRSQRVVLVLKNGHALPQNTPLCAAIPHTAKTSQRVAVADEKYFNHLNFPFCNALKCRNLRCFAPYAAICEMHIILSKSRLQRKMRQISAAIEKIKSETHEPPDFTAEIIRCKNFSELSRQEKQQIIAKLIKKITIHKDSDLRVAAIETKYHAMFSTTAQLEVPPRIELGIKELQSTALPLGYGTVWSG